ncbi:MAG: valine--tRNA ligase [Bacilli bacterium]|nr:valine--tRNA ligase [Bacilli bacterium]
MLDKKYNHIEVEKDKYNKWKEKGYFNSGDLTKEPFCIVIPPPNVTGKLHLGHAWDTTLQDIIIRYKRMQGYDCLWLPGMDHAAIATEAKVVKRIKEQGKNKSILGREKFLEECWNWTHEYSDNIRKQWAKLGLSVDYNKEAFTLDENLTLAVKTVFCKLYNEGLIYRGERIINWDPEAKTALSNEEVIYKDTEGAFYHIKYFIEGTNDFLEVATTRPETLFGDTAVAVNPEDTRYNKLIGKNVVLPIVNKLIPIIGDNHADMDFGTGVVKITPAHDPNDFEVGNRHNLERIIVMNDDATMNENAGIYKGLDRFECRKKLVEDLKEQDLLISIEKITHNVGHSERTGVMVEPYLSKQWFVDMKKLSKQVLDNQKNKDTKVNFVPERFEKILINWMEDCHDWCISRQLWWGHRIPAWYKNDEIYVGINPPQEEGWTQDEDVLDTWFSSALWPFATLGWPNETPDFKRYFPNDVLVTGYDIIFFWVCRMVFQSLEFTEKRPFKDCLIHGLIRDKEGRKMSKSLGNGVDPMDVIDTYGCDSLRFFLTTNSAPGQDLRYDEEKVKSTWNFINKIWNASRYVLMNLEDFNDKDYTLDNLTNSDKWILTKLNKTIESITKSMDKYDFNIVGNTLYNFIWTDFCDKYIELSKFNQNNTTKSVLLKVLTSIIKMLHPFMPYVTEEIYQMLPIKDSESIMISTYPKYEKEYVFNKEEKEIDNILEFITLFRNKKLELNIGSDFKVINNIKNNDNLDLILNSLKIKDKLTDENTSNTVKVEYNNLSLEIVYDNTKNLEEERTRLEQELTRLTNSIERRKKLLSNENYTSKAPLNIVNKEKEDLSKELEQLEIIKNKLK